MFAIGCSIICTANGDKERGGINGATGKVLAVLHRDDIAYGIRLKMDSNGHQLTVYRTDIARRWFGSVELYFK